MKSITILNGRVDDEYRTRLVRSAANRFNSQVKTTTQHGDAARWARAAADADMDRIIIAGGDGTVHEVVQGLAPEFPQIATAIIPLGTGNDLARSLDLPLHDVGAAAEAAYSCETASIDLIHVSNGQTSYCVNAASGGFGGAVTFDLSSDAKRNWGAFAYWFAALGKLNQLPEYEVEIQSDSNSIQTRVVGIGINNGRFVGGGFPLAARAALNDGNLAITVVPVLSPLELMGIAVDLSLGRSEESEQLIAFRTRKLKVACKPAMPFSLDGETEITSVHQFEVLRGKLEIGVGSRAALIDSSSEQSNTP